MAEQNSITGSSSDSHSAVDVAERASTAGVAAGRAVPRPRRVDRTISALLSCIVALAALPSCNDASGGSTPTQPQGPTLTAAQITLQVTVNQATAASQLESTGPAQQQHVVTGQVQLTNTADGAPATLQLLRVFLEPDGQQIVENITPPAPDNVITTGGTSTFSYSRAFAVPYGEPFTHTGVLTVHAEAQYTDSLGNSGSVQSSVDADPKLTTLPSESCAADSDTACLDIGGNGRFKVEVQWRNDPAQPFVPATIDQLFPPDETFWFFDSSQPPLLTQVQDGCPFNDHFWLYFESATNVEFTIIVEDTQNNVFKEYRNTNGETFAPVSDFEAFATCPGPRPSP